MLHGVEIDISNSADSSISSVPYCLLGGSRDKEIILEKLQILSSGFVLSSILTEKWKCYSPVHKPAEQEIKRVTLILIPPACVALPGCSLL